MVTNMSSQLTCQVFLETMKTCLSSSVQYQKMGQHSKVKGAKTILGFISRILCMVFQHGSLAYMNLQSSHTDKIYWTSFTPITVYSKQRDLSKCSIYNSSGGPAQFAGPYTSTYIIRRTDLLIQATKMESAWKNERQIVFHPSSPGVLLSSRLHFADPRISRQRPLRSWKGSCRTAESYSLHISTIYCWRAKLSYESLT